MGCTGRAGRGGFSLPSIRLLMRINQQGKKRGESAENQQHDGHRLERRAETGLQRVVDFHHGQRENREPCSVRQMPGADGQRVEAEDADDRTD